MGETETVGPLLAGVLDATKPWDGHYTVPGFTPMISKPRFDEFRAPVKEFEMAEIPKHKIDRKAFSCAVKSALHGAEGGDDTFSPKPQNGHCFAGPLRNGMLTSNLGG